jgi:hypothetical protein
MTKLMQSQEKHIADILNNQRQPEGLRKSRAEKLKAEYLSGNKRSAETIQKKIAMLEPVIDMPEDEQKSFWTLRKRALEMEKQNLNARMKEISTEEWLIDSDLGFLYLRSGVIGSESRLATNKDAMRCLRERLEELQ